MKRFRLAAIGAALIAGGAIMLLASAGGPNLVANSDFSGGVAGWDNFSGNPQPFNGAMKITNNYAGNGNSYYSGWYCVGGVQAGTVYGTSTEAFVEAASPDNTGASIGLHYYAAPDCSGSNLGGGLKYGGFVAGERGQWITLAFSGPAPAGANSVRVRATAVKHPDPYNSSIPGDHIVLFDNVYFGEADVAPPPTSTPTNTPTSTPTSVPTSTPTAIPTAVPTNTPAPQPEPTQPPFEYPGPVWEPPVVEIPPTSTPTPTRPKATQPTPPPPSTPVSQPPQPTQPTPPQPGSDVPNVEPQVAEATVAPLPPATGTGAAQEGGQGLTWMLAATTMMFAGLSIAAFTARRSR